MLRVFKFGGALMKDAEGIRRVASIIEEYSCEQLVVVVSALGKTTNALENLVSLALEGNQIKLQQDYIQLKSNHINLINELFENGEETVLEVEEMFRGLWDKLNESYSDHYFAYDQTVGYGEMFSSTIIANYLKERNLIVKNIDAGKIIYTDSNYTDAAINWAYTTKAVESLLPICLSNKQIVLTQGFVAANKKGNSTTLGREGSDFTAAILANILDADEITIWKDVPGLMNADPNRFENSVKLDKISYYEAIELAFYGASVIHPKTIQPLKEKNIPLHVRSFNNPASKPSIISNDTSEDELMHKIIVKDNQVLLSITSKNLDFISEEKLTIIFKVFSRNKIHINLMQNSAVSFSVCFNNNSNKLKSLLINLKDNFILKYNTDLQLITIRHYNESLINQHTSGKKVFLEQKSRITVQLLVR